MDDPRRHVTPIAGVDVLFVMATEQEYGAHLRERIDPLITGIGPVEAAVGVTAALAALQQHGRLPDVVFTLGSAGSRRLEHAAVYQVASVSYRDMDAYEAVDIDGNGGTFASEASDVSVGGELRIELSGKGDVNADGKEIDIDDLNVTGSTALNGSEQIDRIEISDSTFTGKFTSTLGGGNDVLDLDTGAGDPSRFLSSVAVDFGAGTDTLDNNPLNTFASPISGRRGPEVIV